MMYSQVAVASLYLVCTPDDALGDEVNNLADVQHDAEG